jgi:methylase of polypeptide subunit release factors
VSSRHEHDTLSRFRERYAVPTTEVGAGIERRVIGAAWGANGYTTVRQADELARRLNLRPGRTLLDVGTGRGWPGVYLVAAIACRQVGTDMPLDALATAGRRARTESIDDRVGLVAAAGADQPLRSDSFDAIVHTGVLC